MKYHQVVQKTNEVIDNFPKLRLTVRQIFYRLVSPPYQIIPNTRSAYNTFDRILTKARAVGDVNWERIEDSGRVELKRGSNIIAPSPKGYVQWLFDEIKEGYHMVDFLKDQPRYIEAWVEKKALSPFFASICGDYCITVFPSRGHSNFTSIMEAIEHRFPDDKPTIILLFTDHDPSGLEIPRDLDERFKEYDHHGHDISIKKIALTSDQVKQFNLAPNPTKSSDSGFPSYVEKYGEFCWELDAIPPNDLREIILRAFEHEIDQDIWITTFNRLQKERQVIADAIAPFKNLFDKIKESIQNEVEKKL